MSQFSTFFMEVPRQWPGGRAAWRLGTVATVALLIAACGIGLSDEERLGRATAAFDDGDYRSAVVDAKTYLQSRPNDAEARILLARASIALGDAAAAKAEFERAVKLGADADSFAIDLGRAMNQLGQFAEVLDSYTTNDYPEALHSDIAWLRGDANVGLNQLDAARVEYQRAIDLNPENVNALLGIAAVYRQTGNPVQARANLDQVLGNYPEVVAAWLQSGYMHLEGGNLDAAVNDFSQAETRARSANRPAQLLSALYGLSEANLALSNEEATVALRDRMLGIAPDDPRTGLIDAKVAVVEDRWGDAQRRLQSVLTTSPGFPDAERLLGFVHKQRGNLEQAEFYLSRAVKSQPDDVETRRLLAETRLRLQKFALAEEALAPLSDSRSSRDVLMIATTSSKLGDREAAIGILERAVEDNPAEQNLLLQLAFEYLRAGRKDEALATLGGLSDELDDKSSFWHDLLTTLAEFGEDSPGTQIAAAQQLAERWPNEARAQSLLGTVLASSGEYGEARSLFEHAVQLAPEDSEPVWFLAQLDESEGRTDEARRRYEEILVAEPRNARVLFALARLAIAENRNEDAIDLIERYRAVDPASGNVLAVLAQLYIATGDVDKASAVAREGIETDPKDARLLNILGMVDLRGERYSDAEARFSRVLEREKSPEIRFNLARSLAAQGEFTEAIEVLDEDRPGSLKYLPSAMLLASMEFRSGDTAAARRTTAEILSLHPEAAIPHALQAELLSRDGELLAAAEQYDIALAKDPLPRFAIQAFIMRRDAGAPDRTVSLKRYLSDRPLDSRVRLILADEQMGQDALPEASANYQKVLAADPDNYIALNNLAWAYFRSGDARAVPTAREAYRTMPTNASVMDTLGWLLFMSGEKQEGLEMLRRASSSMGATPQIRFHFASALADTGAKAEAKIILEELVAGASQFSSRSEAEALLAEL